MRLSTKSHGLPADVTVLATDRATARALVEAGYMPLSRYLEGIEDTAACDITGFAIDRRPTCSGRELALWGVSKAVA